MQQTNKTAVALDRRLVRLLHRVAGPLQKVTWHLGAKSLHDGRGSRWGELEQVLLRLFWNGRSDDYFPDALRH